MYALFGRSWPLAQLLRDHREGHLNGLGRATHRELALLGARLAVREDADGRAGNVPQLTDARAALADQPAGERRDARWQAERLGLVSRRVKARRVRAKVELAVLEAREQREARAGALPWSGEHVAAGLS